MPIPRWAKVRPVAVGKWRLDILIVVGVQQNGDKLMVACTRYSGDDLDTRAIDPSQWKMTRRRWTGVRPMAAAIRHAFFSSRAKTNLYLKLVGQIGKNRITVSTQWTNSGLMAMS